MPRGRAPKAFEVNKCSERIIIYSNQALLVRSPE
jgi:hypothetical protein